MQENDVIELLNETIAALNGNVQIERKRMDARLAALLDLVQTRFYQLESRLAAIEGSRQ